MAKTTQLKRLTTQLRKADLPLPLREKAEEEIKRLTFLEGTPTFPTHFYQIEKWINWLTRLPWQKMATTNFDLVRAKKILDSHHYGLTNLKERILEELAVMSLRQKAGKRKITGTVLCFVGLVGTGKTTIARAIAEAMGRPFVRIPLGGLGDPFLLRGRARVYPHSEPGAIIKGLVAVGVKNPVILLDEIDRVADEARTTIMGVLVELLDPEQHTNFIDHYIDYPFDLSSVLFIATANNTRRIATAVLDRLEIIQMPSYTDQEKLVIGRDYLLPRILAESGLSKDQLTIAPECWPKIIRPLGWDAGVRTLKRTIEGIVRKAALSIVEGKTKKVQITLENLKQFLPSW